MYIHTFIVFWKKKGEPNNKEKWSDRVNNKEKRKHTSGSTDDSTITTTLVDSASNGLWSCLVSSSSFSGSQKASGSNKREEEGSRWRGEKKKKTFDIREKRHGPFHACRRQSESIENFPFLSTFLLLLLVVCISGQPLLAMWITRIFGLLSEKSTSSVCALTIGSYY